MRSVSSYMNDKLNSAQQTPANKAAPQMKIQVSRARSTIMNSDYWTVETIRSKSDLGDISVTPRRYTPYGQPNRIYEIHVDNGNVFTAIREYPDTFKAGWINQFTVGGGSSVALSFDGNWKRYRAVWRLVTEEKPWIFWVDSSGILWRQLWDDAATLSQLDTDVSYVKAIRAWRNQYSAELDQGIIVGYIKTDGSLWYRNYCRQIDGTVMWDVARQITAVSNAVNFNLFLTNDYRVGFCIEKSNQEIQWLITQRNWAGMALVPENIQATLVVDDIALIPVSYSDQPVIENIDVNMKIDRVNFCPADVIASFAPSIVRAKRMDDYLIEIEYDTDLDEVSNCFESFMISNNSIVAVAKSEARVLQLTTANQLVSIGSWTITYDGLGEISSYYSEYCRPEFGSFTVVASGDPPFVIENIGAAISVTEVSLKSASYVDGFYKENISAAIEVSSIVLLKVGDNPL